ncbi:MAG: vitamin K epoxide reductase family protein [Chloroflexota bacterium]
MSSFENTQSEEIVTTGKSRDWLYTISLVLVVIGIVISGYLSYVKLTDTQTICVSGGAFNCEVVQSSKYATLFGIPIAYLGFATYLVIGALLLLQNRVSFLQEYGVMIEFGVIMFAFLFSAWLVYLQAFQLKAFCMWCLSHELTMTLLFVVSILRLKRSLS